MAAAPVKQWKVGNLLKHAGGVIVIVLVAGAFDSPSLFRDVSNQSGIEFVLHNGATPEKHQIEAMAGGVAVFDFDNDGYPDLYFANGARQPSLDKADASYWNRLYRNRGDGTFEDVTEKAGVKAEGYTTGVAAADFDNDGYVDLFVAGVRRSFLFRNRGDGTFEDVTTKAGIRQNGWAISGGWFDYDNDGKLDLFVVNYVAWDPKTEPFCGDIKRGIRTYCHPKYYKGLPNTLYHNNGDVSFTDVSEYSGISRYAGKGMAVAFADYDHDGRIDAFVANDTVPNFLFHNEGGGRFKEVGMMAGVGMNDDGRALSSMGTDFRDVDNDGWEDVFVTALANETFPLYRNGGTGLFTDSTYRSRIGALSLTQSGWGAGVVDFDNDGWKDVFVASGDVNDNTELFSSRKSRQPNLLFMNQRNGTFRVEKIGQPALHRGVAFGDFDLDGRVDAVVTRIGEKPVVLRNTSGEGNHWLALRLIGTKSNRDGLGARVRVVTAAGEQWNHATTAVGYACSSDKVVHFGLGKNATVTRIEIEWPSGVKSTLENVKGDRYLIVREPSS
jgi:enediyne biosynthesis protein E4